MPNPNQDTLNYSDTGTGETVVLLHGMLGSSRYWSNISEILDDTNRVIAVDLLGFGNSPKPKDNDYATLDHVEFVTHTLDGIGIDKPVILVGHSMGALIALKFATLYPERVRKLVLISLPIYKDVAQARRQIKDSSVFPDLLNNDIVARTVCVVACKIKPLARILAMHYFTDVPKDVAADTNMHTWMSYSRSMKNVIENQQSINDLAFLNVPTVLLFGSQDKLAIVDNRVYIENNQNISIKILNGGHQIPLELPKQVAHYITMPVTLYIIK